MPAALPGAVLATVLAVAAAPAAAAAPSSSPAPATYIVSGSGSTTAATLASAIDRQGGSVDTLFPHVGSVVATLDADDVARLSATAGVLSVERNTTFHISDAGAAGTAGTHQLNARGPWTASTRSSCRWTARTRRRPPAPGSPPTCWTPGSAPPTPTSTPGSPPGSTRSPLPVTPPVRAPRPTATATAPTWRA